MSGNTMSNMPQRPSRSSTPSSLSSSVSAQPLALATLLTTLAPSSSSCSHTPITSAPSSPFTTATSSPILSATRSSTPIAPASTSSTNANIPPTTTAPTSSAQPITPATNPKGWSTKLRLFSKPWHTFATVMACATMYYTVHTHSLASWTAKKDYCEFQKNFENGTTASQCSISRPPAKRAMATPWIFARDNAWGKLLSSFPTRSNLERIAAIGVIIVITALHFCDLSSLWYRIARGKQPSGSYFTVSWPKIYTPLQARLSLWLPVDTILPDDYNDQDSYIRGHGRNLQTNVISREIQELEKRLNNAAKGISLALQESRRSRRANDQMMSIIFPICFALQYFYGETIILLFERNDTSFFIALVVLIIVLPLMSDIVGTILTCWIAGKMRIKDSEAYPLD